MSLDRRHEYLLADLEKLGLLSPLQDPTVTDLIVADGGHGYIYSQDGTRELAALDATALRSLITGFAALGNLPASGDHPVVETTFPLPVPTAEDPEARTVLRIQGNLPPLSPTPTLAIRKPPARLLTLEELAQRGALSRELAHGLAAAYVQGQTLVISGGVGSGKTTLATALLHHLTARQPDERLVVIEDGARELALPAARNVNRTLTVYPRYTPRELLRNALRLLPTRIILGEARGGEAFDFLKSCNTGHPGGLTTLHANSCLEALERLDLLCQEAGVPSQLPLIARTVDVVVHMTRTVAPDGACRRAVVEAARVVGMEGGRPVMRPLGRSGEASNP